MNYSLEKIAEVVSGELSRQDSSVTIQRISSDSRTVAFAKHTLFFAIQTDRNDGHKYVQDAYNKGVRNFIVEKAVALENVNVILVTNSVDALHELARYHRTQYNLPTLGITGSNGKTIVKEWLNQMMASEYNIVRSPKSYNSQIGVPMSVLNLGASHNFAIFEAGISQPGEMQKIASIIQPTLGILTNIGRSHLENFISQDELLTEKMKLFLSCQELIIPGKLIDEVKNQFPGKIITWGTDESCNFYIHAQEKIKNQTTILGRWQDRDLGFMLPFTDLASCENAITCITTLLHLGFSAEDINLKLQNLTTIPMRLNIVAGKNNCTLINDSYSLDLASLEIALDFLKKQSTHKHTTVILSDVVESGKTDLETYCEINNILNDYQVNTLIAIGDVIGKYKDNFTIPTTNYQSTHDFLTSYNGQHTLKNTDILIKGARKFQFEKVVAALEAKSHSTVLEINLNAIVNNLNYFKSIIKPEAKIMVMVKALSYGSGTHEIAQLLAFNQVDYLGVAYTDEGIALRNSGNSLPIMVMNPEWSQLIENKLEPEIFSLQKLDEFNEILEQYDEISSYPIHLKIDSGMHRLGFEPHDIPILLDKLKRYNKIQVASVFTHLAATDSELHDAFTHVQLRVYQDIVKQLKNTLGYSFLTHSLNTAGILRFPNQHQDMVRLGIGLYGISSVAEFQQNLENVGTLKTYISQVKNINKGETVGYNRAFIAPEDTQIATIPIGYADGYSRAFSQGVGEVICKGVKVPVIGNVCMDMTMIDVTGLNAQAGDEVIVFGRQLPVEVLADKINTITYEIISGIADRVKRVFIEE